MCVVVSGLVALTSRSFSCCVADHGFDQSCLSVDCYFPRHLPLVLVSPSPTTQSGLLGPVKS